MVNGVLVSLDICADCSDNVRVLDYSTLKLGTESSYSYFRRLQSHIGANEGLEQFFQELVVDESAFALEEIADVCVENLNQRS